MTKKTSFSTFRHRRRNADTAKFEQKLDELIAGSDSPPDVSALSDLSRAAVDHLRSRWTAIDQGRREAIVRAMIAGAEEDVTKHYDRALQVALDDPQPAIRVQAVDGLAESEGLEVLDAVLQRMPTDESANVRTAMARLLSRFALKAEYGEIDTEQARRLRETLVQVSENDPNLDVRLTILESLGYFSDEERVPDLIRRAFESGHHEAQVSALRSMGRQADPRWTEQITRTMDSDESELRYEAARAAGLIGTHRVVPKLIDLTDDEDVEVQRMAIASLGEIGGDTAMQTLRNLAQSDSPAVAEAAEAALDAAALVDHPVGPPRVI